MERLPVEPDHDPGVGQEPVVGLKATDVLVLAVRHGGAGANEPPDAADLNQQARVHTST